LHESYTELLITLKSSKFAKYLSIYWQIKFSAEYMYKFILFISLLFNFFFASAQYNNVWYFGRQAALSFNPPNTGGAIPHSLGNSVMIADEGCSSVCDTAGNILFYTNGVTVYNKNHQVMLNGDGLAGNLSAVQSGLIVPHPGISHLYYVFTTGSLETNFTNGYNYSIVDMQQDGGAGAVVTKNILLESSCTERMAAIRHADGRSVWFIGNDNSSNTFRAWLISCQGLQPTPIVSTVGDVINQHQFVNNGMLKGSPDGKYICQTQFPLFSETGIPPNFAQLFDFDNTTGQLTNVRKIGFSNSAYTACEFSPNSKMLYLVRTYDGQIDQLEVTLPSLANILASRVSARTRIGNYGIQLAPDGKIYLATANSRFLSTINNPDEKAPAFQYTEDAVALSTGTTIAALPSFINDVSKSPFNSINYNITDSCNATVQFSSNASLPLPLIYEWDFGDGTQSNIANPTHTYNPKNRLYTVRLKITTGTGCGNVQRSLTFLPSGQLPISTNFKTFGGCDSGYLRFELENQPPANYSGMFTWYFGDGNTSNQLNPTHVFANAGTYHIKLKYKSTTTCLDDSTETNVDLIRLSVPLTVSPPQTIYSGQKISLFANGTGKHYNWTPTIGLNNASINKPIASPAATTTYKVKNFNDAGCFNEDSIKVTVVELTDVYIPNGFTPNNDGNNDIMYPMMGTKFELLEFSIFSRWGERIFTTKEKGTGWNGTVKGILQDSNAYVWVLRFKNKETNAITEKKGSFTLIR
jgi:gliding motility-associated-like protein